MKPVKLVLRLLSFSQYLFESISHSRSSSHLLKLGGRQAGTRACTVIAQSCFSGVDMHCILLFFQLRQKADASAERAAHTASPIARARSCAHGQCYSRLPVPTAVLGGDQPGSHTGSFRVAGEELLNGLWVHAPAMC